VNNLIKLAMSLAFLPCNETKAAEAQLSNTDCKVLGFNVFVRAEI